MSETTFMGCLTTNYINDSRVQERCKLKIKKKLESYRILVLPKVITVECLLKRIVTRKYFKETSIS
jgi:hypothetical protein